MRVLTLGATHPWLRNALMLLAVVAVLYGGARLWTSGPDAVHITITHVAGDDGKSPATTSVTYDRTIPNGEVAQRLQRDLAALPLVGPFAKYSCSLGSSTYGTDLIYDAYTLTWYRGGLPVEQASANRTDCAFWRDDGVFTHTPYNAEVLYADIAAVVATSG
jgi:hypothetical protein